VWRTIGIVPHWSTNLFTQWGNQNFAGAIGVNVQNQLNIADWPCFSKYYLTFPLNSVPVGKAIQAATLTLHQWGGSDPNQARPSLIQVLTVAEDWNENTITWNNAPLALENVSQAWVDIVEDCGAPGGTPWPCIPRQFDSAARQRKPTPRAYRFDWRSMRPMIRFIAANSLQPRTKATGTRWDGPP
jgi:hypothetical protein